VILPQNRIVNHIFRTDVRFQQTHHQRLAEIHGWFTEGFDTVDLLEANALLDELAQAAS
jgi:hypothetical protein